MFLTAEDFNTPPFNLPQLDEVANTFPDFVAGQEKDILTDLFGRLLYEDFAAAVLASQLETNPVALPDRYVKLKDGDVYVYLNIEYKWVGVVKLLIPIIYARWIRDRVSYLTSLGGEVQAKTENSDVVTPSRRIASGENTFSKIAGNCYCRRDTLYGYLSSLGTTFDDLYLTKGYNSLLHYLRLNFKSPVPVPNKNMFGL
jgi:hypothetical protein